MTAQITLDQAISRVRHAAVKLRDIERFASIKGSKLLDVGCGTGNTLIAAKAAGVATAIGFDQDLSEFGNPLIEQVCSAFSVAACDIELLEGGFDDVDKDFDFVTCIDVIEHVANPRDVIFGISRALKNGGIAIIDTAPLYYSANGHHLFKFDVGSYPWLHLRSDFLQIINNNTVDEWSWRNFISLNKIRCSEILSYVAEAGFVVLKHQISRQNQEMLIREKNNLIVPDGISDIDLVTGWIHLILMKQAPGISI